MVRAVVPLKDLVAAKTRLSGVLTPSERRALMQAMAEDVLACLASHPRIDAITLVSDDPGAGMLAAFYGATHWPEHSPEYRAGGRLNAVLRAACERLRPDASERIMVLHADLPWLSSADIDAALQSHDISGGLLVGPDREARGTNMLLFSAGHIPDFRFGRHSCDAHARWGRGAGISVDFLTRTGIARDVDEPRHLRELLFVNQNDDCLPGPATRSVLEQRAIATRLRLAFNTGHPSASGHRGKGGSP